MCSDALFTISHFVHAFTWGPPMRNNPHGFMWKMVCSSIYFSGITCLTTFIMTSFRKSSRAIFSECWTETTIVWTRLGMQAPWSHIYSHVTCQVKEPFTKWWTNYLPAHSHVHTLTCVFESGRAHQNSPLLRNSAILWLSLWASTTVNGMHSSVSSVAYPNIRPYK